MDPRWPFTSESRTANVTSGWCRPAGDPVPFLLTPFDERSPRFSPDGKWLAYVSDESGRDDVYVQPFPGPGPKWLVSTDGGIDPVWSKDGRELFYRQDDQMMVAVVAPKGEFSASRPQRLFEIRFDAGDNGPNYDVSPDGKMVRDAEGRSRRGARRASSRAQLVRRGHGSYPGGAGNRARIDASARRPGHDRADAGAGAGRRRISCRDRPVLLAGGPAQAHAVAAETAVRDTLQRYSAALESLDANAVKKVQPSMPPTISPKPSRTCASSKSRSTPCACSRSTGPRPV